MSKKTVSNKITYFNNEDEDNKYIDNTEELGVEPSPSIYPNNKDRNDKCVGGVKELEVKPAPNTHSNSEYENDGYFGDLGGLEVKPSPKLEVKSLYKVGVKSSHKLEVKPSSELEVKPSPKFDIEYCDRENPIQGFGSCEDFSKNFDMDSDESSNGSISDNINGNLSNGLRKYASKFNFKTTFRDLRDRLGYSPEQYPTGRIMGDFTTPSTEYLKNSRTKLSEEDEMWFINHPQELELPTNLVRDWKKCTYNNPDTGGENQ